MNINRYIYFNSRDTFFRIALPQIIFFSADKNYTLLQLTNGQKLVFTFSLQKMEQYLTEKLNEDAKIFARIGKSCIINLTYVYQIDIVKQKLHLYDPVSSKNFALDISKEALKNLRKIFINK
ncbi:MAG: LytTR family transcriptional regulator [Bacteroidales bacterium]|nr:LytTR family transcriptional regulator [Bacteroidales bacterium]